MGLRGENNSALGRRSGGNTKKSRDKRQKGEESVRKKRVGGLFGGRRRGQRVPTDLRRKGDDKARKRKRCEIDRPIQLIKDSDSWRLTERM